MATRSTIAIRNADGTVHSAYCHWDGGPSRNGRILHEHYVEEERARALIEGGDISTLGELVEPTSSNHSYNTPDAGVTVYYGRDRGETGVNGSKYTTVNRWLMDAEEYNYLFDAVDGTWTVYKDSAPKGLLENVLGNAD